MGIFDKLNSVDAQMADDLNNLEESRRKSAEEKRKEEYQRKEDEKNKKRDTKKEKLKSILEDSTEGIDEPHLYTITYEHSEGGGYGYGAHIGAGKSSCTRIMTEREKMIAEVTGKLELCTNAGSLAYGCKCTGIVSVEKANREMTDEEKIKIEAIRKKVEIIKESEEAEAECVIDLYDEEFGNIPVSTSLKYALLSSLNIENGKVNDMDKENTNTGASSRGKSDTKLPAKQKSKITLGSIRRAIVKAFNKGER